MRQRDIGRRKIHPRERRKPVPRHIMAKDHHTPRTWHQKAQQHSDGGGFPGAIAAQKRPGAAGGLREIQPRHGGRVSGLVDFRQTLGLDGGKRHGGHIGANQRFAKP